MTVRNSRLQERAHMIRVICRGLTLEQAQQAHRILIRMTDLELSATYHRRRSFVLGAPMEG